MFNYLLSLIVNPFRRAMERNRKRDDLLIAAEAADMFGYTRAEDTVKLYEAICFRESWWTEEALKEINEAALKGLNGMPK